MNTRFFKTMVSVGDVVVSKNKIDIFPLYTVAAGQLGIVTSPQNDDGGCWVEFPEGETYLDRHQTQDEIDVRRAGAYPQTAEVLADLHKSEW